ncbi:hypothetical protein JTB14_010049 [Gonioctena quinquepunctata]|nr:hypothetical protein JTB14_010049 [Gonioctena quinquepunctata]
MAEYNNAVHSVEEHLQRISISDNQLNFTQIFASGYVEDIMIDEAQPNLAMNVDSDDEGVDFDMPNGVMVKKKHYQSHTWMGQHAILSLLWKGK